jgi:hypothetical protein
MFRCPECRHGKIHAHYGRHRKPRYRCTHCNYRHVPYQHFRKYISPWVLKRPLPMLAVAEEFQRLSEAAAGVGRPAVEMQDMGAYTWPTDIAPVKESWWQRFWAWFNAL